MVVLSADIPEYYGGTSTAALVRTRVVPIGSKRSSRGVTSSEASTNALVSILHGVGDNT